MGRKLTKRQWKNKDRIQAWLKGEPFRENSRAKPAVPDLSLEDVLEQYTPNDITGAGQFFTPVEMAQKVWNAISGSVFEGRVLEPCAGIGNLLYPIKDWHDGWEVVCFELDQECVGLGKRLFPWAEWHWDIPFDHIAQLEGQFDAVVMNPPFGTRRGMMPGQEVSEWGAKKSEHCFLELAVRALKPDGYLAVLGPYNLLDRLPKAGKAWLDEQATLECHWSNHYLPGEFQFTKIRLELFLLRRKGEDDGPFCQCGTPVDYKWQLCPDCLAAQEARALEKTTRQMAFNW